MKPNQDGLEKFDEEIDAALKLMGKTQPPTAMLPRIHRSLKTAAADVHRTRSRRIFWIPATACAITALLLLVLTQAPRTREKPTSTAKMVKMTANLHADEVPTNAAPTLALPTDGSGKRASSSRATARHSRQAHPHDRPAAKLLSYPLTRQEKLLLQFAQTAAPKDLQALNPEHEAAAEAEEKAKFAAYLNPRSVSSM